MYYTRINGQVYGPYSDEQMKQFAAEGRIVSSSEVSTDGQNWESASQLIPEFLTSAPQTIYYEDSGAKSNPSFWGCYTNCWKKFFNNRGRARRKEFFAWFIINALIIFIINLATSLITGQPCEYSPIAMMIMSLFVAASFFPSLYLIIRRFHDMNQTGWLILLFNIPLVNMIVTLILLFVGGTRGPNKYGPNPRG